MKPKYNVLHLITKLELGGAQKNTLHTVEKLDKNRYNVFLVSGEPGILDNHAENIDGVEFITIPVLRRKISPIYDVLVILKLIKLFKKYKIDIVHTHSSKAGIVGRIAARIAKVPIIIHTIHGFGFHNYQHALIKELYVFFEKIAAVFTDKLIAVSSYNIETGLSHNIANRNKYTTIHSGIDIDLFSKVKVDREKLKIDLGINQNDFIVGQVGNFKPQKNPLDFVRMANIVLKKYPDAKFLLIGDGPLRSEVEDLIQEYKIKDKLILTGWRRDVPELMSILDVLVLSSLWEGLPQVFPQAMASGKPIVATKVDGAPEAIKNGENGFLVNPKDFKGLAAHVVLLLSNPELTKYIGENGKKKVYPTFCVNQMVREISTVYDVLITDKNLSISNKNIKESADLSTY